MNVLISGLPAARMGDQTASTGVITSGCFTVLIGDSGDSDDDDDQGSTLGAAADDGSPFAEICG